MTGPEMIAQWLTDFDVLSSAAAPGFEISEIYKLLNRAYRDTVMSLYKVKDWVTLQALVKDVTYTSQITSLGNGQYICPLPSFYSGDTNPKIWLYISSNSSVTRPTAYNTTGFVQTLQTNTPFIVQNQDVPISEFKDKSVSIFNNPMFIKNPYTCLSNDQMNILVDTYSTLQGVNFIYIRDFVAISDIHTCDLQEGVHMSIVTLAVNYGIQVTNSHELKK